MKQKKLLQLHRMQEIQQRAEEQMLQRQIETKDIELTEADVNQDAKEATETRIVETAETPPARKSPETIVTETLEQNTFPQKGESM